MVTPPLSIAAPAPEQKYAWRSRRWFVTATVLLLVLGMSIPCRGEAPAVADEAGIKAAFLFRFLSYVEWPDEGTSHENELLVGVSGDPALLHQLEGFSGRQVRRLRVKLRRVVDTGDLEGCRVLYVGREARRTGDRLLAAARERQILSVSDRWGFAAAGGVIGFVNRGDHVRFQVNSGAAQRAGLRISSHLLRLATDVLE